MLLDRRSPVAPICVVGSGPAGLAVAGACRAGGLPVLLIEAGDDTAASPDPGSLNAPGGLPYGPLDDMRSIRLGGSSWLWGSGFGAWTEGRVQLRPLNPWDLEWTERPMGGWPIDFAELAPEYETELDQLGLSQHAYALESQDARTIESIGPQESAWPFGPLPGFSPVHFNYMHQSDHRRSTLKPLIEDNGTFIATRATVVAIELDDSGSRVSQLRCHGADVGWFDLPVHDVVLATGGIENARLLLDLESSLPRRLHRFTPGECFMDHPQGIGAVLVPSTPWSGSKTKCLDLHESETGLLTRWMLELDPLAMAEDGLAGLAFNLWPAEPSWLPDELAEISVTKAKDQRPLESDGASLLAVSFMSEQLPNPASAVRLAAETDALGRRMVSIDWRLSSLDVHLIRRGLQRFQHAVQQTGQGAVYFPDAHGSTTDAFLTQHWSGDEATISGSHHHMGTTRMHSRADRGVVDVDCQHHQLANLFMAGSSVFPTGGYANPTLTITALGRRLGRHLVARHNRSI
jgi:hypothetical protein